MSLAERMVEWAEGYKAEGMRKGVQRGESIALQRLLTRRFGAIPAELATKIAGASLEQVEAWFDQAIDAGKLDDVFGGTSST